MEGDDKGQIILYQTQDGESKIEVTLANETVWLTIDQMAELFQRNKSTISRHIKNAFEEGELSKEVVVAKYATTTQHGAIYLLVLGTSAHQKKCSIVRCWRYMHLVSITTHARKLQNNLQNYKRKVINKCI